MDEIRKLIEQAQADELINERYYLDRNPPKRSPSDEEMIKMLKHIQEKGLPVDLNYETYGDEPLGGTYSDTTAAGKLHEAQIPLSAYDAEAIPTFEPTPETEEKIAEMEQLKKHATPIDSGIHASQEHRLVIPDAVEKVYGKSRLRDMIKGGQ